MTREDRTNALRMLSADGVEKANSGHPGMPLGMADLAETLWHNFLKHDPKDPSWANRDRFVLSNGHGSMLLYALLHLSGYDVSMDDLKAFRQLGSSTPGHPEWGHTPGVESTSGPLGQGLAHGVGMAVAEKQLSAQFNKPSFPIVDHFTYVFVGDGCLMEGISHEVCSLAGAWGLGKLIVIWDDNRISIDGPTDAWFSDNTAQRFTAYGWHVIDKVDGHEHDAISKAIMDAQAETGRPTLIAARTIIGKGSPKENSAASHGAPLGIDGLKTLRKNLGWTHEPFEIPEAIYQSWQEAGPSQAKADWDSLFTDYQTKHPTLAREYKRRLAGENMPDWEAMWQGIFAKVDGEEAMATRKASLWCLNALGPKMPELVGGSADLTASNLTKWTDAATWPKDPEGQYIYFGVREFGMMAITNGMALHQGIVPFSGTFLAFADYAKSAIRMAALMQTQTIFVFTHDSIGLGEDGPTHQPVEHLAMLRSIPGLETWRPASLRETAVAWQSALMHKGPSCLILSRQSIALFDAPQSRKDVETGAEIVLDPKDPEALIIATGSEVPLALEAAKASSLRVRVVSMPCMERFRAQSETDKARILPPHLIGKTVVVEAASPQPWYEWIAPPSTIIGMHSFGGSAPAKELYDHFGITAKNIVHALQKPGEHL